MKIREKRKRVLPGMNRSWCRQNYAKFWLQYLGWNFMSLTDGRIVTKGQFLESPENEPFIAVEYEPREGWSSSAERRAHFAALEQIRTDNSVPELFEHN